jgi:hypothetical protein
MNDNEPMRMDRREAIQWMVAGRPHVDLHEAVRHRRCPSRY